VFLPSLKLIQVTTLPTNAKSKDRGEYYVNYTHRILSKLLSDIIGKTDISISCRFSYCTAGNRRYYSSVVFILYGDFKMVATSTIRVWLDISRDCAVVSLCDKKGKSTLINRDVIHRYPDTDEGWKLAREHAKKYSLENGIPLLNV
jgi:hypothetical protein